MQFKVIIHGSRAGSWYKAKQAVALSATCWRGATDELAEMVDNDFMFAATDVYESSQLQACLLIWLTVAAVWLTAAAVAAGCLVFLLLPKMWSMSSF